MKKSAYCLFETPIGWCGIAWNESDALGVRTAVTIVQLPEATPQMTEASVAVLSGVRQASKPPPAIVEVIRRICRHLKGALQEFGEISVDLNGTGLFAEQVYAAARMIPAGQTMTYGELAQAINRPKACRAVGRALGRNPIPLIIPCHRILAAGNKPGGFSAPGGKATKARLLAIEGVSLEKKAHRKKSK